MRLSVSSEKNFDKQARQLVSDSEVAAAASPNEDNLRHELENALQRACVSLSIPWVPFQLSRSLRGVQGRRFADVAHGAIVIEYEPPRSFGGREGANVQHARGQAEEYAALIAAEEGRALHDYTVIAWDGSHISFGHLRDGSWDWEALVPFDQRCAKRLLAWLRDDGIPLVHPLLLAQLVGPESAFGNALIPEFFSAITTAAVGGTSKTKLLYLEWRRLFGQVIGIQSDNLRALLERQGRSHGRDYAQDSAAYLFALNTYIALIAKLVSACALTRKRGLDVRDASIPIGTRLKELENGKLFLSAGIANMLSGDFFSWYRDDPRASAFLPHLSPETGGQYTVKRYENPNASRREGTPRGGEIRLKPRNPDYAPIVLQGVDERDLAVIAEVVEVLGAT